MAAPETQLIYYTCFKSISAAAKPHPTGGGRSQLGVATLTVPENYFDDLEAKADLSPAEVDPLRASNISHEREGTPKHGAHSVGVTHQYCGELGKQANCQAAVSLSVANHYASLPVVYRLYLPKSWAEDQKRRRKAGVPDVAGSQMKSPGAGSRAPINEPCCEEDRHAAPLPRHRNHEKLMRVWALEYR